VISRRDLLRTGIALLAGGLIGYVAGNYVPATYRESLISKELRVYNWQAYLNKEIVLPLFTGMIYNEKKLIVNTIYDEFNSAEEAYNKLSLGGYFYDVYNLGTEVIYKAIKNKLIIKLDHNKIPNLKELDPFIRESLKIQYPENIDLLDYGVPYMWGTTGIVYNKKKLGTEITSLKQLFDTDFLTKYSKRIFIIDDQITTVMIALIYLGKDFRDPRSYTEESLREVYNVLSKIVPHVVFLTTDQLIQELVRESVYAGVAWNGDALQAIAQKEDLVYVVPEEGSDMWIDMWSIAHNAKEKDLSYDWINFTLDPWVAALNTTAIWYANPVPASNEYIPEKISGDPAVYPDNETKKRLKLFRPLTEEETSNILRVVWAPLTGKT
jgi:spermidine/putrescine-binding protein